MSVTSDLFFGLSTAFGYGSGDFLARQAARRIGHLRVLFVLEASGVILLVPLAFLVERDGWDGGDPWGLLLGLGLLNFLASMSLYKSFEYGVLSVVSPVASSYPAITAALAFLFLGERPGGLATTGIAVALVGIAFLSRSRAHPGNPPARDARVGLVSAFLAFAGYGILYFALDYTVGTVGPVTSAAVVRTVGTAILLGMALRTPSIVSRPPRELWATVTGIAVFDVIAFLAYNVGIVDGSVAIVGTLSGLFSAVTVGLAAGVLRERLTRVQFAAIGAIFAGVVLMALR